MNPPVRVDFDCNVYLQIINDKDLLDLMSDLNAEGKALREKYPAVRIVTPPEFLAHVTPPT